MHVQMLLGHIFRLGFSPLGLLIDYYIIFYDYMTIIFIIIKKKKHHLLLVLTLCH